MNDVTEKNEMNERMKSMKEGRKEHFHPRIHTLPESFASRDGVDMVDHRLTGPATGQHKKNTSDMYPTLIPH